MPERTVAGLPVNVMTRNVHVADLSQDTRYQFRLADNAYVRAADIARSVRDRGSERFDDNIIAVEINGIWYVLDGYGRQGACPLLSWETVDVDFLQGRNLPQLARKVALRANIGHVSQRGNNARELAIITYYQHHEERLTYTALAEIHRCTIATIARRVNKAVEYLQALAVADPSALRPFSNDRDALGTVRAALNRLLQWDCETFKTLVAQLRATYNVTVGVLVGNNEKQVYRILYEALDRARQGMVSNYLIFFYTSPGGSTGAGQRNLAAVKSLVDYYAPGCTFHGEDLSKGDMPFNSRIVAQYVQSCRKAASSEGTASEGVGELLGTLDMATVG